MDIRKSVAVAALAIALPFAVAAADPLPEQIGQCATTTIAKIGTRLIDGATNQPLPGSGSAVEFANGGHQVSYENEAPIEQSHTGDPVSLCLVSAPRGCPPGDTRGRVYKTTNQRTHGVWTLPDSPHSCGGA